ncbi:hypothetical protein HK096_003243 [Nowakowskiella sp. JEL0078]|nr:hypothetical protein HK096_003243 [Nowakowskiella sp. JEL0078]
MAADKDHLRKKKVTGPLHLIAGGLGSLWSCVLLQPLDLIKTRLQQEQFHQNVFSTIRSTFSPPPLKSLINQHSKTSFNSILMTSSTVRNITSVFEADGIKGLWRGTSVTILRNVPGSAIYFWSLNEIRESLKLLRFEKKDKNANLGWFGLHTSHSLSGLAPDTINMISGASARTFAGFILMPLSVIKTRYESNHYNYKSLSSAADSIYRTEGFKGLFRGFGATTLRDSPYAALYLLIYERLRIVFGAWALPDSPNHSISTMVSGAMAGLLATILTNPFDVVKTRMQVNPDRYKGFYGSVKTVWTDVGGLHGFWSGMTPRLVRKVVAAAITWTIYEEVVVMMDLKRIDALKRDRNLKM